MEIGALECLGKEFQLHKVLPIGRTLESKRRLRGGESLISAEEKRHENVSCTTEMIEAAIRGATFGEPHTLKHDSICG